MKFCFVISSLALCVIAKNSFAQSDTNNQKDADGLKQGYWIFYGKDMPERGYCDSCKIEEGFFKDDRRSGKWTNYYASGNLKTIAYHLHGRPNGPYVKYYENGVLMESCTFKINNQLTGEFYHYYESGCIQTQKIYDDNGKQDINQTYYYDNCDTAISDQGSVNYKVELLQDSTVVRYRYWPDGCPKDSSEEDHFHESPNPMPRETYYKKSINENGDPLMDGEFKDGKLWNGKKYIYDSDGILLKIEIWNNGAYHSDGQL